MSLVFYYHPLASFCHKVLIALYERGVPFEPRFVDLADEASSAELLSYSLDEAKPYFKDFPMFDRMPERLR